MRKNVYTFNWISFKYPSPLAIGALDILQRHHWHLAKHTRSANRVHGFTNDNAFFSRTTAYRLCVIAVVTNLTSQHVLFELRQ